MNFQEGEVLLVDKPYGWTSFDVVNKIRWNLKQALKVKKIKVGHAGTLDPLATGLLIVCTGKFTKQINEYQGLSKEYTGTLVLGATTPSYDLETEPNAHFPTEHITQEMVHAIIPQFLGEIDQIPPLYSALKVDGQRAYKLARQGDETVLKSRKITIHSLEFTRIELPEIDFLVRCTKGTYIRSLVFDIGTALGSGAYMSRLVRTKIGEHHLENAVSPHAFEEVFKLRKVGNSDNP